MVHDDCIIKHVKDDVDDDDCGGDNDDDDAGDSDGGDLLKHAIYV